MSPTATATNKYHTQMTHAGGRASPKTHRAVQGLQRALMQGPQARNRQILGVHRVRPHALWVLRSTARAEAPSAQAVVAPTPTAAASTPTTTTPTSRGRRRREHVHTKRRRHNARGRSERPAQAQTPRKHAQQRRRQRVRDRPREEAPRRETIERDRRRGVRGQPRRHPHQPASSLLLPAHVEPRVQRPHPRVAGLGSVALEAAARGGDPNASDAPRGSERK